MTRPNPQTQPTPVVFDRALVRQHRIRAAQGFLRHNALFAEVDTLLLERVGDIRRSFPNILNLGAHAGALTDGLAQKTDSLVVSSNLSGAMLPQGTLSLVGDEELLPFTPNSFDLVVSSLVLHWVNDLPGALVQIKSCLRPGGAFLAALIGGDSLHELRTCLTEAELGITGGISPRISPTLDLLTASHLMQRAGYDLPVVDQETVTLTYPDMVTLMRDLRGMGEGNANTGRIRKPTRRAVFTEAERLYRERYVGNDGQLPATFDIVFLHGWKA